MVPRVTRNLDKVMGRTARRARRCGVDCKNTSRKALAIEAFNRRFQVPGVIEFNKTEPAGMACDTIPYHLGKADGMTLIFEPLAQFCFPTCMRDVSNEQSQHRTFSPLLTI